jgi:hypothetical protein
MENIMLWAVLPPRATIVSPERSASKLMFTITGVITSLLVASAATTDSEIHDAILLGFTAVNVE